MKNDLPEESEVKKWNLGSFLTEQKSPNEAPQSHEPVKAVKNDDDHLDGENGTDDESSSSNSNNGSNDDSDAADTKRRRTPEQNFHHQENSNTSSTIDKSPRHHPHELTSKTPPNKEKFSNKCDPEIENAIEFLKTLPTQPLSSLSDSDEKMEMPIPKLPSKKKLMGIKRTKQQQQVNEAGSSSSDEDENASQYSSSSKVRRRTSLDADKMRRGRPKKSGSSNSLSMPLSYDQQQQHPSDIPINNNINMINTVNNGAKRSTSTLATTPSHKSPKGSLNSNNNVQVKDGSMKKNKSQVKSKPTVTSSDESSADEMDKVKSNKIQKSSTNHRQSGSNMNHGSSSTGGGAGKNRKHESKRLDLKYNKASSGSSSPSSSSSSQSDSDNDHHSTISNNNNNVSNLKFHQLQSSPVPQSRPSSQQRNSLPPAASSVHRNDSSDQSDSDDSSHRKSKGKVKEVKKGNQSGDKNKALALGKLFSAKPSAANSEGALGKGGKNGGKKPVGQVVVVTEEAQSKLNNNDNLNNCHVQNQHPKYAASPSSALINSTVNNFSLNSSVMVIFLLNSY